MSNFLKRSALVALSAFAGSSISSGSAGAFWGESAVNFFQTQAIF